MEELKTISENLFPGQDKFGLVEIPGCGRGLVTNQRFQPGDVIFRDKPLVRGPGAVESGSSTCWGCGVLSKNDPLSCVCGAVFCESSCKERWHTLEECEFVRANPSQPCHIGHWLLSLRTVLLRNPLTDILEELHICKEKRIEDDIVDYVSRCGVDQSTVRRIHRQLAANTFRCERGRALCVGVAMVNHSCAPNARVWWEADGYMVLAAKRHIEKGEEITITYCCPLLGQPSRLFKLYKSKGFICRCSRCIDSTENQTLMSCIRCTKCKTGFIKPEISPPQEGRGSSVEISPPQEGRGSSVQDLIRWNCTCGFQANSQKVTELIQKYEEELENLENEVVVDPSRRIFSINQFIEKKGKMLHSNHYLLLKAGSLLSGIASYQDLDAKEKYVRKRLKILDMVDPGISRLRGFELGKLYQILFQKIVRDQSTKKRVQPELVLDMQRSLLESQFLLSGDIYAPPEVDENAGLLRKALDPNAVEEIMKKILDKYKINTSVVTIS